MLKGQPLVLLNLTFEPDPGKTEFVAHLQPGEYRGEEQAEPEHHLPTQT